MKDDARQKGSAFGPVSVLLGLALVVLGIYLFVDAPPPLPDGEAPGATIAVERLLEIAEAENDVARALYTREIVGAGLAVGLDFDEDWELPEVQAGPLPALFLRETAESLEKSPARLGLFLGSDFPIRASNGFQGVQVEMFEDLRRTLEPQFFYSEDTGLETAMFPDLAIAQACVTCHNEHPQTPKTDWRLNDVMGATTWTYPQGQVSIGEALGTVAALRRGFRDAYEAYLSEIETFDLAPEIGERWPRDGLFVPSADVFTTELEARASALTLTALVEALSETSAGAETGGSS